MLTRPDLIATQRMRPSEGGDAPESAPLQDLHALLDSQKTSGCLALALKEMRAPWFLDSTAACHVYLRLHRWREELARTDQGQCR
eukprot:36389-Pyramimonas_sp.AAC.1